MPKPRSRAKNTKVASVSARSNQLLTEVVRSLHSQQTSQQPSRPDVNRRQQPRSDRIYSFTQTIVGPTIVSNLAENDGAIPVTLSALTNAAAFATIFDRYRIRQVTIAFHPLVGEGTATSGVNAGPLYTVLDYDDATAATIANLVQYDNLKVAPVGSFFERTYTPRIAIAAFATSVFTSFAQAPASQWLDVASPGISYYGLKYGLPASPDPNGTVLWSTTITVEIEFSHPR